MIVLNRNWKCLLSKWRIYAADLKAVDSFLRKYRFNNCRFRWMAA